MGISVRLRQLIDNKNVTPYVVSMKTGISQATLSRLMSNATKRPSINSIEVLAEYFHVNTDWLMTGDGEMLKSTEQRPTDSVTMSREVFDLLKTQSETMLSQQRTIEELSKKRT